MNNTISYICRCVWKKLKGKQFEPKINYGKQKT